MYAMPIMKKYNAGIEIVGIFDPNRSRAEYLKKEAGLACPVYTDFLELIQDTTPDAAIITTIDRTHRDYIIQCLERGIDVTVEKPMAINDEQIRDILTAEKRAGKEITIAFNYRYAPYITKIKELLRQGILGEIYNVDFNYMLGTDHGSDYFRRWHRQKENSGGLLVHKATHHFDLIN